jgi:predicted nuclease of restriction endonuclease-like RecB superfamily
MARPRRNNKDKVLKYRGVTYRSGFEVSVAKKLSQLKRRLRSFKVKYEDDAFDYVLEKRYIPDFKIIKDDGTVIYIEAKGLFDRESRWKMLAAREQNPDVTFVLLFMSDNKIQKGAKMRYSDWCNKYDFDYSIGTIPERWLT